MGRPALAALIVACGVGAAHAQQIIINQLEDFVLGTWSGTGNMARTQNHCVGPSTAAFRITATGSGAGGAFRLSNGVTQLPYRVEYSPRTGGFRLMSPGVALTGLTGNTMAQCTGLTSQSERLRITILSANLAAATAGNYAGSLTLTVAPE